MRRPVRVRLTVNLGTVMAEVEMDPGLFREIDKLIEQRNGREAYECLEGDVLRDVLFACDDGEVEEIERVKPKRGARP